MSLTSKPLVSVVMPVYNQEQYISDAVDSILNQTYKNFELIIIDNASTDQTVKIIHSFRDTRICLVQNKKKKNLPESINQGIRLSKGNLIARMDGDDISFPERFQKQVDFLLENRDIKLVGTAAELFGYVNGKVWQYPTDPNNIKCHLLFYSVFAHPSVMFYKETIIKYDLWFDEILKRCQDYDLWVRFSRKAKMANLPEILLKYRTFQDKMENIYWQKEYQQVINSIRNRQLDELGIKYSSEELKLHNNISNTKYTRSRDYLIQVERWFIKLKKANSNSNIFPEPAFSNLLDSKYKEIEAWVNTPFYVRVYKWFVFNIKRIS